MTTDTEQRRASSAASREHERGSGDTSGQLSGLTEEVQRQAGAIWNDVKENTRAMAARQQENAASRGSR